MINILNKKIRDIVEKIEDKVVYSRHYLHMYPELSLTEYKTHDYICSYLDELNIKYDKNVAGTGVVAYVNGEKNFDSKKTILFRADIDALPINEKSDVTYRSKNDGVMHACGHDAHTAILLGVCEVLNSLKNDFSGCVKLVFQPGEETTGGANNMINEGVLDDSKVDACFALHVDPEVNTGSIRVKPGSLYASPDEFVIKIKGRGGHGAEPHNCIDPINISAQLITSLMSIVSREVDPFSEAVITIGSIHSGTARNIIPDDAEITGTARSLSNEMRQFIKKRIGEISNSICLAHGAKCEYEFIELFPPLINDEKLAKNVYNTACNILGKDKCIYGGQPTMAGEDFAYFAQNVPSVLFKLGCMNKDKGITTPLHHSSFDIDEDCLAIGVSMFVGIALDLLN